MVNTIEVINMVLKPKRKPSNEGNVKKYM